MAGSELHEEGVNGGKESREGGGEFVEGMAVVDFDMLCSTVAMQTQGKWMKLEGEGAAAPTETTSEVSSGCGKAKSLTALKIVASPSNPCAVPATDLGRTWNELVLVLVLFSRSESLNTNLIMQGAAYFILTIAAVFNWIAYIVTLRHYFLYLAVAFTISTALYLSFFRTRMKKKFNIRGSDSSLDDCAYHIICPCCTLCQESRTLEMNNVRDGMWQGRGDTICIGSCSDGNKAIFGLNPPSPISIGFPCQTGMHRDTDSSDCTATLDAGQLEPLVCDPSRLTSDAEHSVPLIL